MNAHQRRKLRRSGNEKLQKANDMEIVWTEEHEMIKQELDNLLDPVKRLNKYNMLENLKDVFCRDGFRISIQASRMHFCIPKDDYGPWTKLELGFPNISCNVIRRYADNKDYPTESVYPLVPIEVVCECLLSHGGIVDGRY